MRISSLILTGFKSFGRKTHILLDSQTTAIVGPNGSGKSNVAEAIRFVLGEQSVKSMRGSKGSDLIFKGSRELHPLSRASVTIVFDNSRNKPAITSQDGGLSYLQYDEIRVTREVYADGQNEYSINETKVRLKDVQELLASAGIGSSHHTLISQGEADRVLSTSAKERKEIIEDSLGLKVYQYRIKEAERKLEKTLEYLKEGEITRREIAPHLEFLRRQVKKIEERTEIVERFKRESALYFAALERELLERKETLAQVSVDSIRTSIRNIEQEVLNKRNQIRLLEETLNQTDLGSDIRAEILLLQKEKEVIQATQDEMRFSLRMLDREIETKKSLINSSGKRMINIELDEEGVLYARNTLIENYDQILWRVKNHELSLVPNLVLLGKNETVHFFSRVLGSSTQVDTTHLQIEVERLEAERSALLQGVHEKQMMRDAVSTKIVERENELEQKRSSTTFALKDIRVIEQDIFHKTSEVAALYAEIERHERAEHELTDKTNSFTLEVEEGFALIGSDILGYKKITSEELALSTYTPYEHKRLLERLKIKLEESGIQNSAEIQDEYTETAKRDSELSVQIEDLLKTKTSLETLIEELQKELAHVFDAGLAKIDTEFNRFFAVMFGGGGAKLIKTEIRKRKKNKDESLETSDSDEVAEDGELEEGIEIEVDLPQKKVKDISMLSGGERALTSIALLFAMSQVTPPPFMVLDETDAALDEANARRYGAMLTLLAEHSKLIVITHNRETMSAAEALYGVTLGRDGASKILSVKFDEATAYAK